MNIELNLGLTLPAVMRFVPYFLSFFLSSFLSFFIFINLLALFYRDASPLVRKELIVSLRHLTCGYPERFQEAITELHGDAIEIKKAESLSRDRHRFEKIQTKTLKKPILTTHFAPPDQSVLQPLFFSLLFQGVVKGGVGRGGVGKEGVGKGGWVGTQVQMLGVVGGVFLMSCGR